MKTFNNESGNILLYAVIAITFISGLSLYIQKMSDPILYQNNDTQEILASDYLTDSMSTLVSNVIYNNPNIPKQATDFSGINTSNFLATFVEITNQYNNIYLFSDQTHLIASMKRENNLSFSSVDYDDSQLDMAIVRVFAPLTYTIKSYQTNPVKKEISISIRF